LRLELEEDGRAMDSLFITDIHGNIKALRETIDLALEKFKLKYIIIGGDIAPNIVSVKFKDSEFVIKNKKVYKEEIRDDFVKIIKTNDFYDLKKVSGKIPIRYELNMTKEEFLSFGKEKIGLYIKHLLDFKFLCFKQKEFIINELFPLIDDYREKGLEFYCMLGNDDFLELEEVFLDNSKLLYINNKFAAIGDKEIFGYPYVISKPFRYDYWEKSEVDIYNELFDYFKIYTTENIILSIHQPPYGTSLDIVQDDRVHTGSRAIKKLLEEFDFYLILTGHNHESFKMTGGSFPSSHT